ncbi:hypothetical protein [Microbulbifer sp. 2205BS26-8]|uniref:hypothetical protein n=1 Tax=Microbulbifer sp. 2205BS26-8 TaxID=3064386 RepID=UPI00273DC275|nr:hypothetical protein [Microbulbifer sp. 2205BS26-8]MDP5211220.1 hypothetical protein [Microbulbifer sp. 2205BS26-8]
MAITDREMVRRVMTELRVLQSGKQPEPGEYVDIRDLMHSVHAELTENGLINWPLDDLPTSSEDAWIKFVAGRCSNFFGLVDAGVLMRAEEAFRRLIALSAQPDPEEIPVCDY